MNKSFEVKSHTSKDILMEHYPWMLEFWKNGWVDAHKGSTLTQASSNDALLKLHELGYKFDIITQDGKKFENVNINDAHIKLTYNCGVSAPENGLVFWRPVPKPVVFINSAFINGSTNFKISDASQRLNDAIQQAASAGKLTFADFAITDENKYLREIKPGIKADVYDVLRAWDVADPCIQHAIKKMLAPGQRGHKDFEKDIKEAIFSLQRALEMQKEWE